MRSYGISGNQASEAMANIGKIFRAVAEKTVKKREDEVLRKVKEPTLTEKRARAKKQFHKFIQSR